MKFIDDFFDTQKALCKGLDITLFYPILLGHGHRKGVESAKQLCEQCEVVKGCLEYSLHYEPLGIWGGKSEVEREVLRQRRNICLPADRQASHSVRRSVSVGRVGRMVRRLDSLDE